MYKLAYKFGLFLMASLIVLLMVAAGIISMGEINLFSDAMTSGKHSDKNDNYQEYQSITFIK